MIRTLWGLGTHMLGSEPTSFNRYCNLLLNLSCDTEPVYCWVHSPALESPISLNEQNDSNTATRKRLKSTPTDMWSVDGPAEEIYTD